MNQPNFRQLLNSLSYSAWECWRVLNSGPGGPTEDKVDEEFSHFLSDEGQIGDGEGQIGEDEIKESIRSRLRLDRNRKEDALFTGMGCKMDEALSFFQNRWLAGVADSKAINDLWDLLRLIEKRAIIGIKEFGGRSATLVDLERIGELVAVLLGGEPIEAKEQIPPGLRQPYDGGEFVFCVDENVRVPEALREATQAYFDSKKTSIDVGASDPYQIQTRLKKLILQLRDAGFQPPAKRWPRGQRKKTQGERKKTVNVVYFDSPKGK